VPSLLFPDAGSRRVDDNAGRPRPNRTVTVYADAAGTELAEIYADDNGTRGARITTATLTTDQWGMLPPWWGPDDGADKLWVRVAGGPIWPVNADYDARVDALAAAIVGIEVGTGEAAVAAHTVAGDPHGDRAYTDTALAGISGAISGETSARQTADALLLAKTDNLASLSDPSAARDNLGLGGAATLNVGTGPNTVASGSDSRLSDPRTPTSHAGSHAANGGDPLTLTIAQIAGLVAALLNKADLGPDGKILSGQMPPLLANSIYEAASEAEMLALPAAQGDFAIRTDPDPAELYVLATPDPSDLDNWTQLNMAGAILSINGQTGVVTLTAANVGAVPTGRVITTGIGLSGGGDLSTDRIFAVLYGDTSGTAAAGDDARITGAAQKGANLGDLTNAAAARTNLGLGAVSNTSDTDKPVSAAQQTALDAKAPIASPTFTGTVGGVTKAMVGLGSVDNTSDANKPVSTAQLAALNTKRPKRSNIVEVADYIPTGTDTASVDCAAWVQDAINAAGVGGIVIVNGRYRVNSELQMLAFQTLEGTSPWLAGSAPQNSCLDFRFIVANGAGKKIGIKLAPSVIIRNIQIGGPGFPVDGSGNPDPTASYGVSSEGDASEPAPRFYNVHFTKWGTGLYLYHAYYTRLYDCEFQFNALGLMAEYCFNLDIYGPKFRCSSAAANGATFGDGIKMTLCRGLYISGGSFENYRTGIGLAGSTTCTIAGVYFERFHVPAGTPTIVGIDGSSLTGCAIHVTGSSVYLLGHSFWINTAGSTRVALTASGNKFIYAAGSAVPPTSPTIYNFTNSAGDVHLSGDNTVDAYAGAVPGGTQSWGYMSNGLNTVALKDMIVAPPGTNTGSGINGNFYIGRNVLLPQVNYLSTGGLRLAEITNGKAGVATLVSGTATVTNTGITANSRIYLTVQAPGGTVGTPYVSARTAGTSFTITSTAGASDTSTVAYMIVEPSVTV